MKKNEIGSEFWEVEQEEKNIHTYKSSTKFLLSGRTALDFLIKDIKKTRIFDSVYMPSYCCHSMLQPFIDNGIVIKFYEVTFKDGEFVYNLDENTECQVVFIMQYFGVVNKKFNKYIDVFNRNGKTIIEDATHSWFLDKPHNEKSDYIFASLRKWTGLPAGAVAMKSRGCFIGNPEKLNDNYIKIREKAAFLKKSYINQSIGDKLVFLKLFIEAEELLESDYKDYGITEFLVHQIKTLKSDEIKEKRKANATYLVRKLNEIPHLETIKLTPDDVPLFIPIIVDAKIRDKLRKYLINNDIFCPVHWPMSDQHLFENTFLYESSLSLICDQRYDIGDMDKIFNIIKDFFGGKL